MFCMMRRECSLGAHPPFKPMAAFKLLPKPIALRIVRYLKCDKVEFFILTSCGGRKKI